MSHILRIALVLAALSATTALAPSGVSAQPDCVNAFITKRDPEPQMLWTINGGTWRVLTFWTNQPDSTQVERKLPPLSPDQHIEVLGGGTLATWPAHCERQARDAYDRIRLEGVTTEQLGAEEWLCCGKEVIGQWEAYWNASAAPAATAQVQGCPPAREIKADFPQDVEVIAPAIAKPWWNDGRTPADWGQKQTQSAFRDGQRTTFIHVMGRFYLYEDTQACRDRLDSELANDSLPRKDVSEYRNVPNLIR